MSMSTNDEDFSSVVESLCSTTSMDGFSDTHTENTTGSEITEILGSSSQGEEQFQYPERIIDKTWYKILLTFLYMLVFFACGFGMTGISVSLTELYEYLSEYQQIDKKWVRFYPMFFRGTGLILSTVVVGKIYEYAKNPTKYYHLNLHHMFGFFNIFVFCIPLLLCPMISYAPVCLLLHIFWGVGVGTIITSGTILPKALWRSKRITSSVCQACYCFLSLGCVVHSFIIGQTTKKMDKWSPRKKISVIYLTSFAVFIVFTFIGFLPSPVVDRRKVEREILLQKKNENSTTSKSCFQKNITCIKNRIEKSLLSILSPSSLLNRLKLICFKRVLYMCSVSLCFVSHSSIMKILGVLSTSYCEDRGWTRSNSTFTTSLFFLFFMSSRVLGIFLFLFVDASKLLPFYMIVSAVVLLVTFIFQYSDIVVVIGFAFSGFFIAPVFAGLTVLTESFGIVLSGIESGLMLAPNGFAAASPGLVGWLLATFDNNLYFLVLVVLSVALGVGYISAIIFGNFLKIRE